MTEVCKLDLCALSFDLVHLYLPPKNSINKEFLRKLLRNEKEVFSLEKVKFIKVPKYEELYLNRVREEVKDDEDIRRHLPDLGTKSKSLDRSFFFNVVNTLQPEYLKVLIELA